MGEENRVADGGQKIQEEGEYVYQRILASSSLWGRNSLVSFWHRRLADRRGRRGAATDRFASGSWSFSPACTGLKAHQKCVDRLLEDLQSVRERKIGRPFPVQVDGARSRLLGSRDGCVRLAIAGQWYR